MKIGDADDGALRNRGPAESRCVYERNVMQSVHGRRERAAFVYNTRGGRSCRDLGRFDCFRTLTRDLQIVTFPTPPAARSTKTRKTKTGLGVRPVSIVRVSIEIGLRDGSIGHAKAPGRTRFETVEYHEKKNRTATVFNYRISISFETRQKKKNSPS